MPRSELQAFGDAVKDARKSAGLSQEGLAVASGLHRTYVGGVERGERNLGLLNVFAIARGIGVPVAELIVEAERMLGPASEQP